ncbi:MAG: VOC family protein [Gemmataceae bacterium]
MGVRLSLVVVRAANLEKSRVFYESLGLRLSRERHGTGPAHLAAEVDGCVFEVYPRGDGPSSAGVRLGFRVESVAAAVAATQGVGAEVAAPPADGPWGVRAVVVDPDGHRVEITQ